MSATHAERDAVVVLRFRPARNDTALKAELRRASKQQRLLARTIPYQPYDYTVEEYAAHDTARRKIKQRLVAATKTLASPTHESPSYKDDGMGVDCAMTNGEKITSRNRGELKKALNAKRKKKGKYPQADSTVDWLGSTVQRSERATKCVHEHIGSCPCSTTNDPDVQSVHDRSSTGSAQSKDEMVHPTSTEPAITASRLMLDTVHTDSRTEDRDVSSSVNAHSEKADRIRERSQEGYSLVDTPGQQPLSEILDRKRMFSSLNRRLDNERLEMNWTRAQLKAIHKGMKTADSPTKTPLPTTEAIMDCRDDANPNPEGRIKVNGDTSPDRVSADEAPHGSCDDLAPKNHGGMTVNKNDAIRGASGTETGINSSSGATMETLKELYDADGGMGMISTNELSSDRHVLFERTWGPGSCDAKEVVPVVPMAPSLVDRKSRHAIGLALCGKKMKAKIKRLLHIKGKEPVGRPQKELKRIINAWSDSVTEPWELTRREDLNWELPYDKWIDEWGLDIKRTVIPGSLAGKATTNNVSSSLVPKLSDFRNKEELWLYLHPEEVCNVPRDLKSMYNDGGSCSTPPSNATSEFRAELPAYDEVISADARILLGTTEAQKGKPEPTVHCSTSFPQTAPIRPEDLWLYTPRSCTTCGDFGLLPLHYCVECKKMRVDMCSECYGMGHDSCQRDGHEVSERQKIQQFWHSANNFGGSLPIRAASEQRPQKSDQSQSMEQLLTFLTEERSFMRSEIERARSENEAAKMLATHDAAEATEFRIPKLKLLPDLITNGKAGSLKEQKSRISLKDFASTHPDSVDIDEQQLSGKDETLSTEPEKASTETNTLQKPPEQAIHEENVSSSSVPKLSLAAADAPRLLDSDRELIDMDARLRKQEQLQAFRERELCLREKELSLREREVLLDLKERELVEPGHLPTKILSRESTASSMPSTVPTLTCLSNCAMTQTDVPRYAHDATTEDQSPVLESPVSCSEASMPAYTSSPSDTSPPDSPIVAQHPGFSLSAFAFKHLLSKILLRAPRKGIRTHAEKRSRQNDSSEYTAPATKSKSGASPSSRKRAGKLPLSRTHSARSHGSETDSGSNKRRKKSSATKAVPGRVLACPYAKYDPYRYSSSNTTESHYRKCGSHTLREIPQLKQHLYRVHQRPEFHCPRCYSEFTSMTEAGEHARQPTQCAIAPCPYPEKLDNDQFRALKRRQQGKNKAESWFYIFKILFPDAVPPADPYEGDFGTLLVTRLGSYGASNRFAQMVTERAGIMDDDTQVRITQAIQELLPVHVQLMLQPPVTSAYSSSSSLPWSSTTPESSPGDETMVAEHHLKQPNLYPLATSQNVGHGTFPNQQRALRPSMPFKTHKSVGPSHHDPETAATAQSYIRPFERRTTEGRRPDSCELLGRPDVSIFIPTLETSAPQGVTATSLRTSHVDVPMMAPPPIPQHVLQETTLAPKESRRSMDSGYVSMYTRQSDGMDGAGFSICKENAPNSADSLFAPDYNGAASGDSRWDLQNSYLPWNDTAGTGQDLTSRLDDFLSGANKRDLVLDPPGSRLSSAEQASAIPASYSEESHPFCQSNLSFSDPDLYLPSMNNASQDDNFDIPSSYEAVEESWAAMGNNNPWREDGGGVT